MDDLSGLDWSSTSAKGTTNNIANIPPKPPMNPAYSAYSTLQPTPSPHTSARNTPLSSQGSGFAAPKPTAAGKPAATADSFSNLVNFGGPKSNASLSLRERQQQIEVEKRQREEENRKKLQSQYGGGQFWDTLGQGSSGASRTVSPAIPSAGSGPGIGAATSGAGKDDDDDLFAAFNKDTKVDNSSHYPPPPDLRSASAWNQPASSGGGDLIDDDDPFGLNEMKPKPQAQPQSGASFDGDDDILGDLGKPVEQVRRQAPPPSRPEPGKPIEDPDSDSSSDSGPELPARGGSSDPFDKAVAELVDMGFTAENARRGLTESGAGVNVQAAVGWLLDDAHRQARGKQTPRDSPAERVRREDDHRSRNNGSPAWMRESRHDPPSRQDTSSPAYSDDLSKKAAAMGNSFFKTANSLWKSGQKQLEKAVADFQHDGRDPSQPRWMQSAQQDRTPSSEKQSQNVTDEAMMLEPGARPEKHPTRPQASRSGSSRDRSAALPTRPPAQSSGAPKWQQQARPADPRSRLNKQAIEEQSAQAYVSPARRKKTATPQPAEQSAPEPDLLFNTSTPEPPRPRSSRPTQQSGTSSKPSPQPASRPVAPRPPPPRRNILNVSSSVLQASTKHRLEGTAHFKRGDFDAAHTSYTSSLAGIPQSHPLCIVLLTNRALTALKTGSPKQAVDDANAAIGIIGPSRGDGEKVALPPDGEQRDMKDLYGKALSRKAEALEQMEKWSEAGEVWQQCVEAGVGGASAIGGRQRCQKALAPKPAAAAPAPRKPAQKAPPRPRPSATADLATQQQDSAAVQRLREANKAAEAADEEKFALGEKVDARVAAWRDGKRDNLRALLGSLDQVLWEGSGWKKVGLHDLVVANKVKIHYMKAIAKCHPDKVSFLFLFFFFEEALGNILASLSTVRGKFTYHII